MNPSSCLYWLRQTLLVVFALAFLPTLAFSQADGSPISGAQNSGTNTQADSPQRKANDNAPDAGQRPSTCGLTRLRECLKDVGHDQIGIWTSPLRLSPKDAYWLVPFAGATAVTLHYDAQAQQNLGVDKTRTNASDIFSNAVLYGSLAGDAGLYFLGNTRHDTHLSETGRLGAEAVADAAIVFQGLKLVANRQRPNEGNGQGGFWPHGTRSYEWNGSFPSGHATTMFALARVIADEYPSRRVEFAAYALALAVSTSRVTARVHFPSDVLVGGTLGYLIGGYVVHHHATKDGSPALLLSPMFERSTRTCGAELEFSPERMRFDKVGRIINRMERGQ